jgi:hypothetical protein
MSVIAGMSAALILVLILVVQASSGGASRKGTETQTSETQTSTGTTTSNETTIASSSTTNITTTTSQVLYNVTFYDSGPCGSVYNATSKTVEYFTEWGVQLGNWTRTEPSNITLSQIPEDGSYSFSSTFNLTRIVFSVPAGVYNFTLYPTKFMRVYEPGFQETASGSPSASIMVSNSDVMVYTVAPDASLPAECSI